MYAPWGVTNLTSDRQTRNRIYVYDIENINGVVYVGGAFQEVVHRDSPNKPIEQPFLVAFDAASGDIVSSFRPQLNHPVYAILEHPVTGSVIVGGEFTEVNGRARNGIVALDPETGATDTRFKTRVGLGTTRRAVVRGLDTDGTSIYVGGGFNRAYDTIKTIGCSNLVKTNLSGITDTSWPPSVAGGGVWAVALSTDQDRVVVGGRFNRIDGVSRPGVGMVAASGSGALTNTFTSWGQVAPYCYGGYPGCIFVYDLDVADGKVLITGAEHFSSLHDDGTGTRLKLWAETNDTQAGLLFEGRAWVVRHGRDNTTSVWHAYDLDDYTVSVNPRGRISSGAGGFAYEPGANSCVWMGGTIGAMDLKSTPGTSKVGVYNVGFMCPPGTPVPDSELDINNWETPDGLMMWRYRITAQGSTFGVFAYEPA